MSQSFDKLIQELTEKAKTLHATERRITLESVRLVGELDQRKAWSALGISIESYAKLIGLSSSKYFKRAAAARVIRRFPLAVELFEQGDVDVSHLSLIAGQITEANSDVLLEGIRGLSKRDAEAFASRVTNDGRVLDREGYIDFSVRLKVSEHELLQRACEVLAHGGHVPTKAEIIIQAAKDLLEKRDPMKKAERSAPRKEKAAGATAIEKSQTEVPFLEVKSANVTAENRKSGSKPNQRVAVPGVVKAAVWERDEGRCTYKHGDGSICGSRMMIEVDHVTMVCRGGGNEIDNLRLLCRFHNRHVAEENLERDLPRWDFGLGAVQGESR